MAYVAWRKMLHSLYCTWRMLLYVLPRPMGEMLDLLTEFFICLWKMALAHKAFRFPAMSYLQLPDWFSYTFFHKQNQRVNNCCVKKCCVRIQPGGARETLIPNRHGHLLLVKTEIRCPNSWFGVRDFDCQGGVHLRTLSWRKPHVVVSRGPKLIHSLKLIFNSKKK